MIASSNPLLHADYAIIAGFFLVMLAVGFYFAGRIRDTKDYFAGGRQVPWWLSSVSYWMSSFSAFAFVAHSALAYKFGLVPVTIWWLAAVCVIITALLVAVRWRRVATTSPMEFVEERFGPTMRQSISWLGSVNIVLDDAIKIVAIGTVVSASLGFPARQAIIWCGLIMLTYTLLGGLWAVLVTDMVQFVVMLAAVFVLVPLTLQRVGGVSGFVENAPENFFVATGGQYTGFYLILLAFMCLLGFCTRWSLVQRFYAVPTDADARKVCYLAAGLNIVVAPLILFPAMAAAIYLPGVEDPDRIYGLLCRELLPVGMLGLLIAAIFSATMSSLSSDYNAVASVLTTDVYKRLIKPSGSDRHYVMMGRLLTLAVGLLTVGIALVMDMLGKELLLFDKMIIIFVLIGPPTTIPVLAGLLFRRLSNGGAICGFVSGIGVSFVARFFGVAILDALSPGAEALFGRSIAMQAIPETAFMVISLGSTIGGLILGSIIWPGSAEDRGKVARFLDSVKAHEESAPQDASTGASGVSPAAVVGIAVTALGALLGIVVIVSVPLYEGRVSLVVSAGLLVVGCALIVLPRLLVRNSR